MHQLRAVEPLRAWLFQRHPGTRKYNLMRANAWNQTAEMKYMSQECDGVLSMQTSVHTKAGRSLRVSKGLEREDLPWRLTSG